MNESHKCYTKKSYIDNLFVVFSQSFLIHRIKKFIEDKNLNYDNKPTICEIGCYNGRLMEFLVQNKIFVNYIGVDVQIKYIREHILKTRVGKEVRLLCEDITKEIDIEDNSVDIVCSSETLEHIEGRMLEKAIQNMSRILKISGHMIVSFPNNTREKVFHKIENEKCLGHVHFPIHEDFLELCKKCNLKLINYHTGYSLRSSFRLDKSVRNNEMYKKLRDRLGSAVTRAVFMTLSDKDTGGGYYVFERGDKNRKLL